MDTDLRNFGIVSDHIYRSGRPTIRGLRSVVERYGIETVVDLRDRPQLYADRSYRSLGVAHIRLSLSEDVPIPDEAIERAFELIDRHGRANVGPILIHCWKGSHRTGSIVALYRMRREGWTQQQAWDEMTRFGFGAIEKHPALFTTCFGDWRP